VKFTNAFRPPVRVLMPRTKKDVSMTLAVARSGVLGPEGIDEAVAEKELVGIGPARAVKDGLPRHIEIHAVLPVFSASGGVELESVTLSSGLGGCDGKFRSRAWLR
jgi:hypothetical protein